VYIRLNLDALGNIGPFVAELEKKFPKRSIDIFYANAGAMPNGFTTTKDGIESAFGTMHLAHFSLFMSLRSKLDSTASVIVTASESHRYMENHEQVWWNIRENKGTLFIS